MLIAIRDGFLLAFGLILPLGVQNTFILTQGALHRRWAGALPAVITAAICDTLLVTLAVAGVSMVVLTVPWLKGALSWVGVVFLAYMGWLTWRTKPEESAAGGESWPMRRQITFAASVSLLNPHAILDTVAVIGSNSLHYTGTPKLGYTLAVIGVSWLWFFGLATAGFLLGTAASGAHLRQWLNKISAVIMWYVGLQFLLSII